METQYFLFGEEASRIYHKNSFKNAKGLLAEHKYFVVAVFDETSTAEYILNEYTGWGGFTKITEKEYKELLKLYNSLKA